MVSIQGSGLLVELSCSRLPHTRAASGLWAGRGSLFCSGLAACGPPGQVPLQPPPVGPAGPELL